MMFCLLFLSAGSPKNFAIAPDGEETDSKNPVLQPSTSAISPYQNVRKALMTRKALSSEADYSAP